ncbi:hypothetical protein BA895_16180 [Humibacillus sp. DSM 29435]|uniref:3-oxo-tetronate kinase n=1 Tax=Humibacillus sp. DSM 29435 TaxID=1869167 RepID=UPI000871E70E|nr:3-oxo-tetronate kinase [Humibacillus sp. DSM 29435]OFE17330.1 hypothetical protein BA895_16180 [Humibacillus sp. DSM 29435]
MSTHSEASVDRGVGPVNRPPFMGCVADDITGATDLASALCDEGWRTVLVLGVPTPQTEAPRDCDAIVVALKSRTQAAELAVADSLAAIDWLTAQGVSRFYVKYCSTFDSTAAGNIGPVTDAVMEHTGATVVVHAPSYPRNGRTVYQGHLFVGRSLLSESGMERHPLTPMTDPNLVRVLQAQTPAPVLLLSFDVVTADPAGTLALLSDQTAGSRRHVIADAVTDGDLDRVATAGRNHVLMAGGAAFGAAWARALGAGGRPSPVSMAAFAGQPGVVLVGSASATTTRQVATFEADHRVRRVTVDELDDPGQAALQLAAWAQAELAHGPVIVTADTSAAGIQAARERFGHEAASERIERTLGHTARNLLERGVRRLVVAGGETSGAVAAALGIRSVGIGPSIATGVPWTVSDEPRVAIAFKSGNFGGDDFFAEALACVEDEAATS